MADLTSDDVNALRETLASLQSSLVNLNRDGGGRSSRRGDKAENDKIREIERQTGISKKLTDGYDKLSSKVKNVSKEAEKLDKEFGNLNKGLSDLKKVLTMSGGLGVLVTHMGNSIKTYRQMAEVGQTFSGSMLKMQEAAAEARLPLEEFAAMVKKSSLVIAATGIQSFTAMGVAVRENLKQYGMLNMTTEQLNDFMGDYMETQRSFGLLSRLNEQQAAASMQKLAIETTKVANLTGKNREEIAKTSQTALKDESMRALMLMSEGKASQAFIDSLNKATTYMAGLPGEAGDIMSRMMAQTVARGTSVLADDMQGFVDAGMTGVLDLVDNMKRKIESGSVSDDDMENFRKNFVSMGKQSMTSLKYLADTGDAAAKKAIKMVTEMSNLDGKKLKEIEEQKTITKWLMNLQERLKELSGFLREKFFKALGAGTDKLETFFKSDSFKKFEVKLGELATKFGNWISRVFSDENVKYVTDNIEQWAKTAKAAAVAVWEFGGKVIDNMPKIVTAFDYLTSAVTKTVDAVAAFSKFVGGPLNAALVTFAGLLLGKKLWGAIREKLDGRVSMGGGIRLPVASSGALLVHVTNLPGSLGGRSQQRGGGRATSPTTRAGRVGYGAGKTVGRVGRAVGKGISKVGKVGNLARVGAGAGASLAVGAITDYLNPTSGVGKTLAGAANGAAMGSMLGPWGAAVGGVVGGAMALMDNWEQTSEEVGGVLSSLGNSLSGGLDALGNGISGLKNFMVGIFDKVGGWLGDLFGWMGSLFSGGSALSKILSASPMGAALMNASKGVASIAGSVAAPSTPKVDVSAMQNEIKELKAQQAQIFKENAELRGKIARMTELMEESLNVQRAGMSEMINETKKGNRDLGNIARGTI